MIALFLASVLMSAGAEEKTCVVKGMECQNCVEMVTKGVCTDVFSVCRVRLIDKKKHLGELALATKSATDQIDMARIDGELAKLTYAIESCAPGLPKVRR